MLIRFDELEPSVVSHMKGGEGEARLQLVQDVDNKIMRSVLAPGASIGLHTLSLIHISEPTRPVTASRMPSSA